MLQRLDTDNLKRTTRGYFRRSRRQIALEIAVVAGAFAIMAALYFGSNGSPQAALRTEAVATGNVERTVTALAKVQPKTFVDVGTQVSGQLRLVPLCFCSRRHCRSWGHCSGRCLQ